MGAVVRLRLALLALGACFRLVAGDRAGGCRFRAAACGQRSAGGGAELRCLRTLLRERVRPGAEPADPVAAVLPDRQRYRNPAGHGGDGLGRGGGRGSSAGGPARDHRTGVEYSAQAKKDLRSINNLGLDNLPVCMAKTQKSLSDNERKIGRPKDFTVTVREFEFAAGAGFVIPILGDMMRMPGLPSTPASEGMDIDEDGIITGLS